jgi:hypothetical protein
MEIVRYAGTKNRRTKFVVVSDDIEPMIFNTKREAESWIADWERNQIKITEFNAINRRYRIDAASTYLAKRFIRETSRPKQLTMF